MTVTENPTEEVIPAVTADPVSAVTEPAAAADPDAVPAVLAAFADKAAVKTRPRAKKREIAQRETKALALLAEQPVSIFHLSRETGISFPRAQKLVARLLEDGRVVEVAEGKRTLYKTTGTGKHSKAAATAETAKTPPVQLPPVNSATILNKFHMGREFLVVGIHITPEGEYVELKSRDADETIRVAIV